MDFQEVFSKFAETVLMGLLPVIAGFVVVWLKAKITEVRLSIEESKPDLLYYLDWAADIAVRAAEQSKLSAYIVNKRLYAFEVAEALLKERGFDIDADLIYAAIEAEVLKQFPKQ